MRNPFVYMRSIVWYFINKQRHFLKKDSICLPTDGIHDKQIFLKFYGNKDFPKRSPCLYVDSCGITVQTGIEGKGLKSESKKQQLSQPPQTDFQ
jgi:hypothetical protein